MATAANTALPPLRDLLRAGIGVPVGVLAVLAMIVLPLPPLARALFHNVEIGGEVPAQLYVAVAQVLTYVYRLKAARICGDRPPEPPVIDSSIETTRH